MLIEQMMLPLCHQILAPLDSYVWFTSSLIPPHTQRHCRRRRACSNSRARRGDVATGSYVYLVDLKHNTGSATSDTACSQGAVHRDLCSLYQEGKT